MPYTLYTKELLQEVVAKSLSISAVLRDLGLKQSGGNHTAMAARIKKHEIDTSHFTGAAWNKGQTAATHDGLARQSRTTRWPDEKVFVENSNPISGTKLSKRLLAQGWQYACQICGISEWLGKKLTLHLDHKNGVHNDNRYENLRFLCPNCHQQTETWGNTQNKPS